MSTAWQAPFIAPVDDNGGESVPASYLRSEFGVGTGLQRASLRLTGLGIVDPWVNGERVGDEVLAPGWTSYRHRLVVSSHDVTDLLRPGVNAVGVAVADGWALGRLGWENERFHFADRRAITVELTLDYGDRIDTVVSDTTWKAGCGGTRSASIYDGETFDARLEPKGWSEPGFDDRSWGATSVFDWPIASLIEPVSEPIRRTQELAPRDIITTPSGRTVVDFGQEISGWVRLRVDAPSGSPIVLTHAEWMTQGEIDTTTLRTAKATDVYIADGSGPQTWEPRFTFHGFRYVQVDGWPGALDPTAIRAVVVHTDMRRTGWLSTSNPQLNRLHENVVWSMRDNFVGVPTDCPQRDERLGWTGDINAFAPTAAFLYDVRGVLGSWLEDLAAEQADKGFVPWVVPDVLSNASSPTALWSDVAVSLPWVLYQEYGDPAVLERAYQSMTRFVRDVARLLDDHGLWSTGFQYGDWLDPSAPDDNPAGGKTDRHLVAAAYFAKVTREMASTAQILHRDADAAEFTALASRVRNAFRREYVTESGRVSNETVTAYALAIVFRLLDENQTAHAGALLAALVAKDGYTISTGFAGTPLVADALTSTGHHEEAYLLLTQQKCPSFLYPVTMGATTIWERWDSVRPDGTINPSGMTSLNHYALGAVADWMHRTIGGLTATAPGYRTMRIAPIPGGGVDSAELSHETVYGRVEIRWSTADAHGRIEVTVPEGTDAVVVPPLHVDQLEAAVGPGVHLWDYELDPAAIAAPEASMDTPLSVLGSNPGVWARVSAVLSEHLPGIPIDHSSPEAAGISLRTLLDYIPGEQQALRDALEATMASITGSETKEHA